MKVICVDDYLYYSLTVGLVNLLVCSLFANVLFMPYLAHQMTFMLGLLSSFLMIRKKQWKSACLHSQVGRFAE